MRFWDQGGLRWEMRCPRRGAAEGGRRGMFPRCDGAYLGFVWWLPARAAAAFARAQARALTVRLARMAAERPGGGKLVVAAPEVFGTSAGAGRDISSHSWRLWRSFRPFFAFGCVRLRKP